MAEPSLRGRTRSAENSSYNESVFDQLKEMKNEARENRNELNARMDRIERRMDRLEQNIDKLNEKIDETRRELSTKIDKLADKIDSSSNHGQIATISSIGVGLSAVSITLGVLYALIFK